MELEKTHWVKNSVICPIDTGDFTVGDYGGAGGTAGTLMQGERRR